MRSIWRTALWALGISLAIAGVALFILVRFVLPGLGDTQPPPMYTIGEWEGQVAVFERDQPFPKQVFDSFVDALPQEQQQQVRQGIPVEDETQLSLLLEDLTS